ncbi:MAG: methyltransferase domain-containing protein [Oligoflexales bacterium]|nr:methyltransferase domain-containing protein [Oligoflexales bacterium]
MDLLEINRHSMPQQRHPWELARFDFFQKQAAALMDRLPEKIEVLDVGAGDAWFSARFSEENKKVQKIVCLDSHYQEEHKSLPYLASKKIELTRETPKKKFELIFLLDVLEHIENDTEVLREIVTRNMKDNGLVIISVPAWQTLFSSHDRDLLHFRRYSPARARTLINASGLTILRSGGLFHSLLPVRVLQKLLESSSQQKVQSQVKDEVPDTWNKPALFTRAVLFLLAVDTWMSHLFSRFGINIPGLTWWAVCKRNTHKL